MSNLIEVLEQSSLIFLLITEPSIQPDFGLSVATNLHWIITNKTFFLCYLRQEVQRYSTNRTSDQQNSISIDGIFLQCDVDLEVKGCLAF